MKCLSSRSRLFLVVWLLGTFCPFTARAVCTWQWEGEKTGWVCPPGETVTGDYFDIYKYIRDGVTGPCAQALGNFYEKDFECLAGIAAVIDSGGIVDLGKGVVGVGGGCPATLDAANSLSSACADNNIQFTYSGVGQDSSTLRACNTLNTDLRAAVGYQGAKEPMALGWRLLPKNTCTDLASSPRPMYLRVESLDGQTSWVSSQFSTKNFCVGTRFNLTYNIPISTCNDLFGDHASAIFGQIRDTDNDGVALFNVTGGGETTSVAFSPFTGTAIQVAAGGNAIWKLGPNMGNPEFGYSIFRWNGTAWIKVPGEGTRIAVDQNGNPWIVNLKNQIYRYNGSQFQLMPGTARDIGIGQKGSVWKTGVEQVNVAGYGISEFNGTGWTPVNGAGIRVTATSDGTPYVVNAQRELWYRNASGVFNKIPGVGANDVSIASNGIIWILGTNVNANGRQVMFSLDGKNFSGTTGFGNTISVDRNGKAWVVNNQGLIYVQK